MSLLEKPRNLAIMAALWCLIVGIFSFWIGYSIGSQPQQIIVHLDAPLVVQPTVKP
jgi:hypothetical protein